MNLSFLKKVNSAMSVCVRDVDLELNGVASYFPTDLK